MALSLNNIVNVDMVFSPKAAQTRGFGILCILGDTKNVITAGEGYRTYTSSDDVATDFGDDAPETLAAMAYFSQSPKPQTLIIAEPWDSTTDTAISTRVSKLFADYGRNFYGFITATSATVSDDEILKIAQIVESSADSHIYGITLTDLTCANSVYTDESTDLPSKLKRGQYTRTIVFATQYDADDAAYRLNKYLCASALGRMFSVNFSGSMTTITLKFKQAPSLQPTNLTQSQDTNLTARNVNKYVIMSNDTYIIEEGVMSSGMWADERHGSDWLQDLIQTTVYNVLYQSKTKIPQTDDGVARLMAAVANAIDQAVINGFVAPGVWNSDPFGDLESGAYLEKGYYLYAPSVNDQLQTEREARKSPVIQAGIKLAGAIHSVPIIVNINR